MADSLSQSEVDSLLSALDSGEGAAAPSLQTNISVYDFKRPERVSKDQMRSIQSLHDGFSREFAADLSGLMRSMIEVTLVSTDQLTYGEFVFSLENPTCINLIEAEELGADFLLDLQPAIVFPIIDRLLGGHKEAASHVPNRPMTDIELVLVKRITDLAVRALSNAWTNVCEMELRVTQTESNPQLVQIVPPNEVVILLAFEIVMGDHRGVMNLCIPFNTIEPLAEKFTSDTWSAYTKKDLTPLQKLNLETSLESASVEVIAQLADTKLTAGEVAELGIGDLITTDRDVSQGLTIWVKGQPMFTARPGLLKGHKAIEIGQHIDRIEDVIAEKLKGTQPNS